MFNVPYPKMNDEPGGQLWNNLKNVQMDRYALEKQGIENEFLRPNAEQNLLAQKLKNKFTPLDMAIKAQNALVYNNRFGNIGMYLRSIGEMPSNERSAYLAQPENYNFYNNMLEQFKYGMKNPQSQGSILSPEYVASFGIGAQNQNNSPQAYENGDMPQNALRSLGTAQGLPGGMNQGMGVPPAAPGSPQPPTDLTISPQQAQQLAQAPQNLFAQAQAARAQEPQEVAVPERDQARLAYLQNLVNQKAVPNSVKERLSNVMGMEKWLIGNRDEYIKTVTNAAEYLGPFGQFKYFKDMATGQNKEKREDYILFKHSILPELTSLNTRVGGLRGTDKQRAESKEIVSQAMNWQLDPYQALNVFNKQLKLVRAVGNSLLDVNEPLFKGVNKKLYSFTPIQDDYIPQEVIDRFKTNRSSQPTQSTENTGQLKAPEGKILVEYQGRKGYLPADKWGKELEAKGYRRIS